MKYHAALGLAYAGDASVASLVFSEAASKVLGPDEQTAAALALGAVGRGPARRSPSTTRRTRSAPGPCCS